MEKYKVIGKEIVEGEFKGIKYMHLKLYCTYSKNQSPTLVGDCCVVQKVKKDTSKWYNQIQIGDTVKFYFDRYGNVADIICDIL